MFHTSLCDLLGIRYPVLQGAMQGAGGPELVAAVSNAAPTLSSRPAPGPAATLAAWRPCRSCPRWWMPCMFPWWRPTTEILSDMLAEAIAITSSLAALAQSR